MALNPFDSYLIADTGISMGDEGKGRLVFEIIEELKQQTGSESPVDVVLKVNGGANSGHTVAGLKLNLLPSGVAEPSVKHLVIGSGVVADPHKLHWEAKPLEAKGYPIYNRLIIDERTQVSDVSHRLLDLAYECYRTYILKKEPRGSTGRGITPAYQDETGQWQIYYADFLGSKETFAKKIQQRAQRACKTIQFVCESSEENWDTYFETLTEAETRINQHAVDAGIFLKEDFDFIKFKGTEPFSLNTDAIIDAYWNAGTALRDKIRDARDIIIRAVENKQYTIGEFGQSFWLDKRHGFSPNVTASHTFTPEFFQSAGIPIQPIHNVGACKAYDTKVGTHLFLTQMPEGHPLRTKLEKLEFGVTTNRQRMVGWFDAVEKGDALRYGGFQDLAINKLDALTYSGDWQGGELLICVGYKDEDGNTYNHVPRNDDVRKQLQPVYLQLPGWTEDISNVRSFNDLPINAQRYIAIAVKATLQIAQRTTSEPKPNLNLRYIGVGPDPKQIIKDVPETETLLTLA